jgi:hypothetical protein
MSDERTSNERDVHTIPDGDLLEHVSSATCWCQPREDEPGLWVHNSMDRREEYERGRKLS